MVNGAVMDEIMKRVKMEHAREEYIDLLSNVILDFMTIRYTGIKNADKLGFVDKDDPENSVDKLIQAISDEAKKFMRDSIDNGNEHLKDAVEEIEKDIFEFDGKVNVVLL